jgi:hypothetical protein
VLALRIPKPEQPKPRRISIDAARADQQQQMGAGQNEQQQVDAGQTPAS